MLETYGGEWLLIEGFHFGGPLSLFTVTFPYGSTCSPVIVFDDTSFACHTRPGVGLGVHIDMLGTQWTDAFNAGNRVRRCAPRVTNYEPKIRIQ